jgi:four helix bundle protein
MGMFNFKGLIVWQKAMDYSVNISDETDRIRNDYKKYFRMLNQLDDSSFSVHSNIAEGKGRYSKKEYIRFLHISRGSLFESVSQLIFFHKRGMISLEALNKLEDDAGEIGKMLNGLINSIEKSI